MIDPPAPTVVTHRVRVCRPAYRSSPFYRSIDIAAKEGPQRMNGERNDHVIKSSIIVALALVLSASVFGWFYSNAKKGDEAVTVTGSAKKRIKSDLVLWSAGVTTRSGAVAEAYQQLTPQIGKIKDYLVSKGIPEAEMTVSSVTTITHKGTDSNGNETSEVTGYSLTQRIEVRSADVDKISGVARAATELLNQGILIDSGEPQYYYTKIGDLKVEMLGEAAKDAKERAEKIAGSTGNSIGPVRSARMGVLQITPPDSTEVSDTGMYSTTTIDKDITAVVNISFSVD